MHAQSKTVKNGQGHDAVISDPIILASSGTGSPKAGSTDSWKQGGPQDFPVEMFSAGRPVQSGTGGVAFFTAGLHGAAKGM